LGVRQNENGEAKMHVIMALMAIITDELSKWFYCYRELSKCAQQARYKNFMVCKHITTIPG
jgi:hypothetical protein